MRFEPNENLAITPRVIYQDMDMDGYNRTDIWNMLGNPFTTTQPRVALEDRQQYTQLQEKFTDEFLLADLTIEVGFGRHNLTSISSYTDRDILVIRDATQLTGSVTYFNLGGTGDQIRLDSPLHDATTVRCSRRNCVWRSDYDGGIQWVGGGFYSDIQRRLRPAAADAWLRHAGGSAAVRRCAAELPAEHRPGRSGRRHAFLLGHSV